MAQGVDRWSTPEAGIEDGVQALALQGDEDDDLRIRGRAGSTANTENSSRCRML